MPRDKHFEQLLRRFKYQGISTLSTAVKFRSYRALMAVRGLVRRVGPVVPTYWSTYGQTV